MLANLRARARALKNDTLALYFAAQDSRTPWYAKLLVLMIVAYTFSPIDLVPDFVPILGLLDDLILVPLGLALAIKLIPTEVLAEARMKATSQGLDKNVGRIGTVIIIVIWGLALYWAVTFVLRLLETR